MTISIHIEAPSADIAREEMARLLGSGTLNIAMRRDQATTYVAETDKADFVGTTAADAAIASTGAADTRTASEVDPAADNAITTDEADKRAVGEASGGRKRRTKDEIAADEALTALAAAKGVSSEKLFFAIGQAGRTVVEAELRKQPDADKAGISTGENRVDPENPEPEDDEATQAQDAADEAAEVEATRKADTTIDDVKAAVQLYVDKYGLKVTQEDGPKIFVEALGAPPAGEAFWKFSILPTDADKLAKVVSVWKRAAAENPLKWEAR